MTSTEFYNRLRMRGAPKDLGAAMLSVLMLILVLTSLAILVLTLTLSQTTPTLMQDKNVRTLAAAQAGLDAAAFQIRHAALSGGSDTFGDINKLPCSVAGPVEGDGANTSFEVQIRYYKEDPEGQDETWLAENALDCEPIPGHMGGLRDVARYALLTAEGFDPEATAVTDRADRTLEATYTFQLTTRKLAGGRIWDNNSQFCWVAESPDPGARVYYRSGNSESCKDPSDVNLWTWADDYMIHLSSTDAHGAIPLCLTGRHTGTTPQPMRLSECTTTSTDPDGQRFAWTGQHTWRGQNSNNTGAVNSYIIKGEDRSVYDGMAVAVGSHDHLRSVNPDPAVGKGNASYETDQVVNHQLFGRCLDVTDADINRQYMITYPCKQDPGGGGDFDWNHKWYYSEPGLGQEYVTTQIMVIRSGVEYCLIAPTQLNTNFETAGTYAPISALFPRFHTGLENGGRECNTSRTEWKRYGYNDDESLAYHIVDANGRCLSAAGPRTTHHEQWSTVIVEECSESEAQQWNVPTDPVEAALSGYEETSTLR